jgi:flavin-dependent dehydrogenase
VLPPLDDAQHDDDLTFYKGRFPISPAHAFTGDRYVLVGDGAGLVRPFKGKGVNSALLTGIWAAQTMLQAGISQAAFQEYHYAAREIVDDLPYGQVMRALTRGLSRWRLFDAVIAVAERDERLRRALFDAVSAHRPYRVIIRGLLDPGWMVHAAPLLAAGLIHLPGTERTSAASSDRSGLGPKAPAPPHA